MVSFALSLPGLFCGLLLLSAALLSACAAPRYNPYEDHSGKLRPRENVFYEQESAPGQRQNSLARPRRAIAPLARRGLPPDAPIPDKAHRAHKAYMLDKPGPISALSFDNQSLVHYIVNNKLPSRDFFELEKADNAVIHAWKQILPRLNLSMGINYPVFGLEGPAYMNQDLMDRLNVFLVSSWNMNFFSYFSNIMQARANEQLTEIKVRANREAFALRCMQLYYSLVAGQQRLRDMEKMKEQRQRQLDLLRSGKEAGVESELAYEELLDQSALDEIAWLEGRSSFVEQYEQLKLLLELPHNLELELAPPVPAQRYELPGLEDCLRKAVENNAFLFPMNLAQEMLGRAKVAAFIERFTNFRLFVSVPSYQMNDSKRSTTDDEWLRQTTVGVNWSLPIYDGGEFSRRLTDIDMNREQLKEQRRASLREMAQNVRILHRQCGFLEQKIAAQQAVVRRLENTRAKAAGHEQSGLISREEVRQTEARLKTQQDRLDQWKMDRDLAHFRLRVLMGEGLQ